MNSSKKPFYRHTSILLALAFTVGVGVGSLSDSLNLQSSQASVLQRSPFIQDLSRHASIGSLGKSLAYEVYDGNVVDDKVGDDTSVPDTVKPVDATPIPKTEPALQQAPSVATGTVSCDVPKVTKPVYKGTALIQTQAISLNRDGTAQVTIAYQNNGNIPWFSDASGCKGPFVQLGTTHELDRASAFMSRESQSGWADNNRIYMSTPRVDPGASAMFTFKVQAPSQEDAYREMFGLVIPGMAWVQDSDSALNITVGQPYDADTLAKKFFYINGSGTGAPIDINAEKKVDVNLTTQKAALTLGDYVVREFNVSTGSPKHPTPVGTWHILFKQQVRIGGASPFYIMPKWQAIRPDGYGFHGLPSLGSASLRARIRALGPDVPVPTDWFANDTFWTEALDHIGSPRSHGCVRYLPADSDYVYDFTDIGTPVVIHK